MFKSFYEETGGRSKVYGTVDSFGKIIHLGRKLICVVSLHLYFRTRWELSGGGRERRRPKGPAGPVAELPVCGGVGPGVLRWSLHFE